MSIEKHAGGAYRMEDLNVSLTTSTGNHGMFLPKINQFIPTNFDLEKEQSWTVPRKLNITDNGELWFKDRRILTIRICL